MQQPIRFEENLYFLNEYLNAIEAGLELKIDGHIYFDKVVEDIFFIDATLNKLYAAVSGNYRLVQATAIFRSIQISKIRFADLLERITLGKTGLEDNFTPFIQKLKDLISEHRGDAAKIRDEYLTDENSATPREGISSEEYQFLFPDKETI